MDGATHARIGVGRPARGWTALEAAMVLALAAVLAGMAWPGYSEAVLRSRRADAQEALKRVQQAQQQQLAREGRFAGSLQALGLPLTSPQGHYRLQLAGADAGSGYVVTAMALDPRLKADAPCIELRLLVRPDRIEAQPASCFER